MTTKYYLTHTVVDPNPDKILKILKDGHLYSSSFSGQQGISGIPLEYVYFSLLGDTRPIFGVGGITFILDSEVLFKRSFRYASGWIGGDVSKTTKVKYTYQNINKVLRKIDQYPKNDIMSPEILLKKRVSLDIYLVAICCNKKLTDEIINYVKIYYPYVKILDYFPKSSDQLNQLLYEN